MLRFFTRSMARKASSHSENLVSTLSITSSIIQNSTTTSARFSNPASTFFRGNLHTEHSHHHAKKRKRYEYEDNYSAALALPTSDAELEEKQNDTSSLLDLSKDLVVEHAARRVDLFFYTLVAYYKTQAFPVQGRTGLQHGRGRGSYNASITQACHSSFIPAFIDETVDENHAKYTSILAGTHFMDSINSTVELPALANSVDDELENTYLCRQNSLAIIQQVALGDISPMEGLLEFFKMMERTFKNMPLSRSVRDKIIALEKQGTFAGKFSLETHTINYDYVELLLRLTIQEKLDCQKRSNKREEFYLNKIMAMQEEILNTKSEQRHTTMNHY